MWLSSRWLYQIPKWINVSEMLSLFIPQSHIFRKELNLVCYDTNWLCGLGTVTKPLCTRFLLWRIKIIMSLIFFFKSSPRERKDERERERRREISIGCLPYAPWVGIKPTTQAYVLTRNETSNPLVQRQRSTNWANNVFFSYLTGLWTLTEIMCTQTL